VQNVRLLLVWFAPHVSWHVSLRSNAGLKGRYYQVCCFASTSSYNWVCSGLRSSNDMSLE
jgi:hypothetical protein